MGPLKAGLQVSGGLYRDSGKENGNYHITGFYRGYIGFYAMTGGRGRMTEIPRLNSTTLKSLTIAYTHTAEDTARLLQKRNNDWIK